MSRTDRVVARARAEALRTVSAAVAEALQSEDPGVRADAYAWAERMFPPSPPLLDVMRVTRGMPVCGDTETGCRPPSA